jgi:predicted enzyme related to lactoylglutathione lyase
MRGVLTVEAGLKESSMHRSRLCGLVIDCNVEDVDSAADFWSRALGRSIDPPTPESGNYRQFQTRPDEPVILVQKVSHPSRVHLDIETDDIDAEVARLEGLGARRIEKVKTWWVMEAPTGQRFCVVRVLSKEFAQNANQWEAAGGSQR